MITNEFLMTWDVFRAWKLEEAWKGKQLTVRIIWIVYSVLTLAFFIWIGGDLLCGVLFAFCVYRAFFRELLMAKVLYRTICKNYGTSGWMHRIVFDEKEIRIEEPQITMKHEYADIDRIEEQENRVWIHYKNKRYTRLYKDYFVDSTWEECKALLEQKCPGI